MKMIFGTDSGRTVRYTSKVSPNINLRNIDLDKPFRLRAGKSQNDCPRIRTDISFRDLELVSK